MLGLEGEFAECGFAAGDHLGAGARGLPHFAFLATCESASPQAEGALGGLAQRLVRDLGMPAVLAMTERVSLDQANEYKRLMHNHLGYGIAIEGLAAVDWWPVKGE